MILQKTKRRMGPEHEEKKLLDKEVSVSVEEAVKKAIENPDDVRNVFLQNIKTSTLLCVLLR